MPCSPGVDTLRRGNFGFTFSQSVARRTTIRRLGAFWALDVAGPPYPEDDTSCRRDVDSAVASLVHTMVNGLAPHRPSARATSMRRLGAFPDIDLPLDDLQHILQMPPHCSPEAVLSSLGNPYAQFLYFRPLFLTSRDSREAVAGRQYVASGRFSIIPKRGSIIIPIQKPQPDRPDFEFATGVGVQASSLPPTPTTSCCRVAVDVNVTSADVSCVSRDA
ncbi:hypothetical protein DFP72DRAFT_848891 [Ephemerocybe angulata]|uniref:Uncharacterized protein n=1 Tax=Ephemerocybe angulata TaxID=980116 RepID=A0A8H6HUU7_9AGAR|nr:hypothetical protein DFP72DRAFT_848884 [Tulosesus angulatus]KAF6753609.1 hypothetical protein DFP72DRAFT_848891 [Tulosesus angulatus]